MVGFETGPMAEGRPNGPLPFNFLHIWVTASSKGEGNLHKRSASKWCNYSQCLQFQQYHLHMLNGQQILTIYVMDLMGNCAKVVVVNITAKIGLQICAIAGYLSRWRQLQTAMVSLDRVSFHSWTVLLLSQAVDPLWWHATLHFSSLAPAACSAGSLGGQCCDVDTSQRSETAPLMRLLGVGPWATFKNGANHKHSEMQVWLRKEEIESTFFFYFHFPACFDPFWSRLQSDFQAQLHSNCEGQVLFL